MKGDEVERFEKENGEHYRTRTREMKSSTTRGNADCK
jgi:hypothetical protein